jgi:hypothetical protein
MHIEDERQEWREMLVNGKWNDPPSMTALRLDDIG